MRILGLVLLIILAVLGIGIGGAAPVFSRNNSRDEGPEIKIELLETKKEKSDTLQLKDIEP